MFTVVEKVENLRVSSSRHKMMVQIDELIEGKKVFTLSHTDTLKSRTKNVTCDLYNNRGELFMTFSSSMSSFGDAIRQVHRQIRSYVKEESTGDKK